METGDTLENNNSHGDANANLDKQRHTEESKQSQFEDMVSNDGMTAESARRTGGGDENTPSSSEIANDEKPGSKYNINDQAHSQSSKDDFIKTVSNFKHEDGTTPPSAIDSKHLSPD